MHDLAAQADQIGGLAVDRREQREARRRAVFVADQQAEIAVTHVVAFP